MSWTPRLAAPAAVSSIAGGALEIAGLYKSYAIDGAPRTVLAGIDLSIAAGEFVAIVGASGCGKSTLLRLICGLDASFEGEIRLDGRKIAGPGLDRGIVFQDHRLLPWLTIADNVELALARRDLDRATRRRLVQDHLALVRLDGFERAFPHQLSGGMAQRAAIARGLVNDPSLLLLDEPLGALDALTRIKVRAELERIWLRRRATMIMVTHDVAEAVHLASRVVVMSPGPGRILRIVDVSQPYPRQRGDADLAAIEDEILGEIMAEAPASSAGGASQGQPRARLPLRA